MGQSQSVCVCVYRSACIIPLRLRLDRTLYWTDWNREAPKIESASVDGQNRKVLVREGIGLPNALTFNPISRQVCWGDAGM